MEPNETASSLSTSDIYDQLEAGTAADEIETVTDDVTGPVQPEPGYEAPQHWSPEHRELFSRQPRDAQGFILERHKAMEGDYTRRAQEVAEQRRQHERQLAIAEQAREIWGPLAQRYASQGWDEAQVMRIAKGYMEGYLQDPKGFVAGLAKQVGFEIPQPDSEEYVDPSVRALRDELAQLKEQTAQQQQFRQQFQEAARYAQEQQQRQALAQAWTQFSTQVGQDGKPLRPHAEHPEVKKYMGFLMATSPDQYDLERAYAKATEILKPVVAPVDPAKRVRDAKRAATGVQGGGGSQPAAGTRLDFIRQTYDQLEQRG